MTLISADLYDRIPPLMPAAGQVMTAILIFLWRPDTDYPPALFLSSHGVWFGRKANGKWSESPVGYQQSATQSP